MSTLQCYDQSVINLFREPSRLIIAGFTNSGKSHLSTRLISKYHNTFDRILICGVSHHPLQKHPLLSGKLRVHEQIIDPLHDRNPLVTRKEDESVLFVLDDTYSEAVNSRIVLDSFVKGRHQNVSVILITQNIFFTGKYARDIALNASHYFLLRNRDLSQIECLGRQLFGKTHAKDFVEIYKSVVQATSHGYLLIDLSPGTPVELQLRSYVVDERAFQSVFTW